MDILHRPMPLVFRKDAFFLLYFVVQSSFKFCNLRSWSDFPLPWDTQINFLKNCNILTMHLERVYNGVNSRRANWKIFSWELWQIRGVGSCLPACPTYLEFIKSLSQIGKILKVKVVAKRQSSFQRMCQKIAATSGSWKRGKTWDGWDPQVRDWRHKSSTYMNS